MDEATQCLLDGIREGQLAGATIAWNGATIPVCGGPELGGKLLGAGGFRLTAEVTLVLDLADCGGTGPTEKQRLTYTSAPSATARALRVDSRTIFRNALLILECNDPAQSA